jgi:hypothetical protein
MPTLLKLVTATEPLTRSMALRALRPAAMDRRVFDAAVAASADRAWQARIAAYEIVARAPLDEAAPRLVAAAEKETGEVAGGGRPPLRADRHEPRAEPAPMGSVLEEHGAGSRGTWTAPAATRVRRLDRQTFFDPDRLDQRPLLSRLLLVDGGGAAHPDPRNAEAPREWCPRHAARGGAGETIRAIGAFRPP